MTHQKQIINFNHPVNKISLRYLKAATAYQVARKIIKLQNANMYLKNHPPQPKPFNAPIQYIHSSDNTQQLTRPLLLGEKLGIISASILFAPYLAPFYIYKDMSTIELWFRRESPSQYGYPDIHNDIWSYIAD